MVNKKITSLKPSATLSIKAKATELKNKGYDICDLSAGEPHIEMPIHIKNEFIDALNSGYTRYTAVNGILKLREAISEKLINFNKINSTPDEILVSNGGKQAIYNILSVLLEKDDEVIIPAPYWVSYPPQVILNDARPVIVDTMDDNYILTPDRLKSVITDKSKLLILNSPSNPTGVMYSESDFIALKELILKNDLYVLSDEVYERYVYDNNFVSFLAACPELREKVITINAFSKTYAMTGLRIGYAHGNTDIIKAASKYQSQTTSNVNTPTQYAAISALKGELGFIQDLQVEYKRRRDYVASFINDTNGLSIKRLPEGAFYHFIQLEDLINRNKYKNSIEFCDDLISKAKVACVPGDAFGDPTSFRLSYSISEDVLKEGLKRIKAFLASN